MRILSNLLHLLVPHYKIMFLAALLGFGAVGSNVALLATSAYLISMAALHPELYVLNIAIVGVRFFGIARALFRYGERFLSHDVTFRLLSLLRGWFYAALEPLAPARLFAFQSGDLLSRIVLDVETLKFFYLKVIGPPLVAILTALVLSVWLSLWDWRLAGVFCLGFALISLLLPVLLLLLGSSSGNRVVAARARLQALLVDSVQGLAELTAFDQLARHLSAINRLEQSYQQAQTSAAKVKALAEAGGFLCTQLTMAATLGLAVSLVETGKMAGIHLAVVVLAVKSSFEAALPLPQIIYYLQESQAAARRLFILTTAQPEVAGREYITSSVVSYDLTISDLSFAYPAVPTLVLNHLSITVRQGEKIAVVGTSGAGKTTLVNLLLRFYDYHEGRIILGGTDIKAINPDSLRQSFGVIMQQTHIFNHSIRDNILLARPQATEQELLAVVKAVKLDQLVRSLPAGLDSLVGQNGQTLSGGERQRLAIARVLLKNAPIVLGDEATSSLDSITEQAVLAEMAVLLRAKTVITITHRLTQLACMDCIYVLDHGRIVESGTQTMLLNRRGLFYQLYSLQQTTISDRDFSVNV